jgi:hypothetical protein
VGDVARVSVDARSEAYWVAMLDLVDIRLAVDDPDGAAELLQAAAALDRWPGTMGWHQRHRLALARARLALATGEAEAAVELSRWARRDAAERGAGRYEVLATAVGALGGDHAGLAGIAAAVEALQRCAMVESWWLAAALAERYDVDRWRLDAARLAARLVDGAGEDADPLRRLVERRLSPSRSS